MSLAGEPNEKDVFRQRMEDTAVADTIGKWRFEVDIKKKQFKDMDMKDTYLSDLLLLHNGTQRAISERNAKRPGSSHSAPGLARPGSSSASRGLEPKWKDSSSTERVRSLARELHTSIPGSYRKKSKVPERSFSVLKMGMALKGLR